MEKLKARLIFPGCPGADVAVSHRILLGKVWGPKTFIGAAVQGAGGPRAGSPVGPTVPTPFPLEQGGARHSGTRLWSRGDTSHSQKLPCPSLSYESVKLRSLHFPV